MRIKFLGIHNAESKDSRLVSFLVDEVLAVEAGSLTSELSFIEQKNIKAVLLSHTHYDHIRVTTTLAFNCSANGLNHTIEVFGIPRTIQILESHLMDGVIYPEFAGSDSYLGKPALKLQTIEPYETIGILRYRITALPVSHPIEAVGFNIASDNGKSIFYTGDTGPGLSHLWQRISPHIIITDVTFPNRFDYIARRAGHLCPSMLRKELDDFRKIKGYLPEVFLVHLSPESKSEIETEARGIAEELQLTVNLPSEGETFHV